VRSHPERDANKDFTKETALVCCLPKKGGEKEGVTDVGKRTNTKKLRRLQRKGEKN